MTIDPTEQDMIDLLKKARDLIPTPDRWIKLDLWTEPKGAEPRCFCLMGAAVWAAGGSRDGPVPPLTTAVMDALNSNIPDAEFFVTAVAYNDYPYTTHADILALIDHTIASLEAST